MAKNKETPEQRTQRFKTLCVNILAFEGNGEVFYFEGSYSDYEINKARRMGNEEIKKGRYRKLMED